MDLALDKLQRLICHKPRPHIYIRIYACVCVCAYIFAVRSKVKLAQLRINNMNL